MTTLLAAVATSAFITQIPKPEAKMVLDQTQVVAGSLVAAKVQVTFADGLHGYQNPPSEDYMIPVVISVAEDTKTFMVKYPKGTPAMVGGESKEVMTYEGTVDFPVVFRASSKPGEQSVASPFDTNFAMQVPATPPGSVKVEGKIKITDPPKGWSAVRAKSNDILTLSHFKAVTE